MGTLSTEAQKLTWNIKSDFQGLVSNAQNAFNTIVGRVGASASGILNGDVVGINENEIPNMQTAIREYVNNLQQHLDQVKEDAETDQAFRGGYATAVKQFVGAVCQACECVISNLLQFNERLEEVHQAYIYKDTTMAKDIQGQAGELSSNFTMYTE